MRHRFALSLFLSACVLSGPTLSVWAATDRYLLMARGQEIGTVEIRSYKDARGRVTEMENRNRLSRMGEPLQVGSETRFVESPEDGGPVSFSYRYRFSEREETRADGEVRGDEIRLRMTGQATQSAQSAPIRKERFHFPTGENLQNVFKAHAQDAAGASFDYQTLHLALAPQVVDTHVTVEGEEALELPGGERVPVKKYALVNPLDPGNPVLEWRDAEGKLYRSVSRNQGTELVYAPQDIATKDKSRDGGLNQLARADLSGRATAEALSVDTMTASMIQVIQPITLPRETDFATYLLVPKNGGVDLNNLVPQDTRQRILKSDAQGVKIEVRAKDSANGLAEYPIAHEARYLASNRYLQSDDPEIIQTAKAVVGKEKRAYFAVKALQQWVHQQITTKDLSLGFASAREVLAQRQGDCTEHAVLLAALTRAIGIPSRVAVGAQYMPHRETPLGYFVYHMWTEVYIGDAKGGQWVAVDPSNKEFQVDATHIKLADSDLSDPNAPVALSEKVARVMGRLRVDVLDANAHGKSMLNLKGRAEVQETLIPQVDIQQVDLRRLSKDAIKNYSVGTPPEVLLFGSMEGHYTQGLEALARGESQEAELFFEKAGKMAKSPLDHYRLGEKLAALEWYGLAEREFATAMAREPHLKTKINRWKHDFFPTQRLSGELEHAFLQGVGLEKLGQNPAAAVELFQGVVRSAPDFAPVHLHLANVRRLAGNPTEASMAYQRYMSLNPADPRGPEGMAAILEDAGKFASAAPYLSKALALAKPLGSLPGRTMTRDLSVRLALAKQKAAVARSPKNAMAHLALAKTHYRYKQAGEAANELREALRLAPGNVEAQLFKVQLQLDTAEWNTLHDSAPAVFARASGQPNLLPSARWLKGRYEMHSRHYPQAIQTLRQAIALRPSKPEGYESLAEVYERLNNPKAAKAALRQGIANVPAGEGRNRLQTHLAKLVLDESPTQAHAIVEGVLGRDPADGASYTVLAQALIRQNELELAKEALFDGMALNPGEPDNWALLGDVYALQDNAPEAVHYYQQTLKMDPGHPKAGRSLNSLIAQYEIPMDKVRTYLALNDDEKDYLIQFFAQLHWLLKEKETFYHSLLDAVPHYGDTSIRAMEEIKNAIPLLEKRFDKISGKINEMQSTPAPRRFLSMQDNLCKGLWVHLKSFQELTMRGIVPVGSPKVLEERVKKHAKYTAEVGKYDKALQADLQTILATVDPFFIQKLGHEADMIHIASLSQSVKKLEEEVQQKLMPDLKAKAPAPGQPTGAAGPAGAPAGKPGAAPTAAAKPKMSASEAAKQLEAVQSKLNFK